MDACEHVMRLEVELLDPVVRADGGRIAELLHSDFVEHGASGRVWSRHAVIEELPREDDTTPRVEAHQLRADIVAEGAILVTYVSTSTQRTCNRSSLWLHDPGADAWHMRFHQGTPIPDDPTR